MKYIHWAFVFLLWGLSFKCDGSPKVHSPKTSSQEKLLQDMKLTIEKGWSKHHYIIGVLDQPPFCFQNPETKAWEGIAIDIWRGIAQTNNLTHEYRVINTLSDGQQALENGEFDLLIGAFPAVPQNSYRIEYSLPFYVSGLGVGLRREKEEVILNFAKTLVSVEFLSALFGLLLFVFTGAFGMWLIERRRNLLFGRKGFLKGIGNGMYWSAGTVTSVGSGSTLPATPGGKAFSIFWMFIGVLLTSVLVAAIASSLTVGRISTLFSNPQNLKSMTIGCVDDSDGEFYLSENLIACQPQNSLEDVINDLLKGDVEAVVYSEPLLRYEVVKKNLPINVYSTNYSKLYYAFVVKEDDELLHEVNKAILLYVNSPKWTQNIFKYLKSSKGSFLNWD